MTEVKAARAPAARLGVHPANPREKLPMRLPLAPLLAALAAVLTPLPAAAQSGCMSPERIEAVNAGGLGGREIDIRGPGAMLFLMLDPYWHMPEFEGLPYRDEALMATIRADRARILADGIDRVIAWQFSRPSMGAAVIFRDGCAVEGYGEPDIMDKLRRMAEAQRLVLRDGPDTPSTRDAIARIFEFSPAQPATAQKIDAMLAAIRPLLD